jgi:1,4-dihydroxy-2-naphthoate octaprenyltransferase
VTGARVWWRGARPRTLVAGVVPVLVGAAASRSDTWRWELAAALVVAVGLQVGVNLANDAFDGVRGVDTAERLGPPRLVAGGLATSRAVLAAAALALGTAAVAGLTLAAATSPVPILTIGALALLAALLYSGGPRPYAGLGLGEVAVFVFFGLMATCGTSFVVGGTITSAAWWSGAALGLLAVAILVANNLRDIDTDAAAGKRTLAVRLGPRRTQRLYRGCVTGSFAVILAGAIVFRFDAEAGIPPLALVATATWPLAIRPLRAVGTTTGRDLIPVLVATATLEAAFGAALALGLLLERTT